MAMNDGLVNRVRFTTSVNKDLVPKLKDYSKQTMIPVSKLVDIAIERLLDQGVKRD